MFWCLFYSMNSMAEAKESLEEDSSSFYTTPADDSFRFSNLSTSHMSVLKESGPFVAIVLSCWDNLIGPKLQHVWRGAGDTVSQVHLSIRFINFNRLGLCFSQPVFGSR